MSFFKKWFGKRNYQTIWTRKYHQTSTNYITGAEFVNDNLVAVVKYDKDRKFVKSYVSGGLTNKHVDLTFLVSQNPDLKNVLDNYNIKY